VAISQEGNASQAVAAPPGVEKDVAIAMMGEQVHDIDPAITARAVRKIDWFLMPATLVGVSQPNQLNLWPTGC
jgi:hypothetical protein